MNTKKRTKKAFGFEFLLLEGNFQPVGTTWSELARVTKNSSWGKKISLEKDGVILGPTTLLMGFQYPNSNRNKPPEFAFVEIGKDKHAIKLGLLQLSHKKGVNGFISHPLSLSLKTNTISEIKNENKVIC